MPPDGDGDLNVVVRDWKVKGEKEARADRSVSTGGYTADSTHVAGSKYLSGY